MSFAFRYRFSQDFDVPAEDAFLWCTDFTPQDHLLAGNSTAQRQVTHLTDSTVILKDTFCNGNEVVEKEKLVQFYPDRFTWVSTHISGPNKYSQYLYEIFVITPFTSRLRFTAIHIEHGKEEMTKVRALALSDKLCNEDSALWRLFALAMHRDFKPSHF
jgi:hypothetical protein